DDTDAHSGPPSRPAQGKEAAVATVGENFPCAAAPLSLSPGERVNHPPLSDDADTPGGRRCAGLKHKAATAKVVKAVFRRRSQALPLPQERVNHPPLSDDTDAHSGPPSRPAQAKEAAIATVGENFPCDA